MISYVIFVLRKDKMIAEIRNEHYRSDGNGVCHGGLTDYPGAAGFPVPCPSTCRGMPEDLPPSCILECRPCASKCADASAPALSSWCPAVQIPARPVFWAVRVFRLIRRPIRQFASPAWKCGWRFRGGACRSEDG